MILGIYDFECCLEELGSTRSVVEEA